MKKTLAWLLLAVMLLTLCGCGGKSGNTPEEAAAETESVMPEPTEKPTPKPTSEPTPEPTEAPTPEPTAAPREDRDGFDEKTNTSFSAAGIDFPIPSYYREKKTMEEESLFSVSDEEAVYLIISAEKSKLSEDELAKIGTTEWKKLLDTLDIDSRYFSFKETVKGSIAGFPAFMSEAKASWTDVAIEARFAAVINEGEGKLLWIVFLQREDDGLGFDYLPDFERICENANPSEKKSNAVSPELVDFLDSYEAVMNEYCDFMEGFSKNSSDLSYLMKYADMLAKYSDMAEKAEAWEEKDMSDADTAYYLEVMAKVSKRLLEAGAAMY